MPLLGHNDHRGRGPADAAGISRHRHAIVAAAGVVSAGLGLWSRRTGLGYITWIGSERGQRTFRSLCPRARSAWSRWWRSIVVVADRVLSSGLGLDLGVAELVLLASSAAANRITSAIRQCFLVNRLGRDQDTDWDRDQTLETEIEILASRPMRSRDYHIRRGRVASSLGGSTAV